MVKWRIGAHTEGRIILGVRSRHRGQDIDEQVNDPIRFPPIKKEKISKVVALWTAREMQHGISVLRGRGQDPRQA